MQPKLDWKPPSRHGGFGFADQIWRSPHGDSWAPTHQWVSHHLFHVTTTQSWGWWHMWHMFHIDFPSGNLRCRAPITSRLMEKNTMGNPKDFRFDTPKSSPVASESVPNGKWFSDCPPSTIALWPKTLGLKLGWGGLVVNISALESVHKKYLGPRFILQIWAHF